MVYLFILLIVSSYILLKIILDIHQIHYIKNAKASKEELNDFSINDEYFRKSNLYNIDKLILSIIGITISGILIIYFIYLGGISSFGTIASHINFLDLDSELFNIVSFFILMTIINIPVALYRTFYIEEKYGFNKNSFKLFLKDILLSTLITVIIISILFGAFDLLFTNYPQSWWLYIWMVYIIFNILILYAFPTLIAPMFNNFEKLSDSNVVSVINELAEKTKFNISDVYVMDGSKRSTHSNAYFTGFYKSKRIVFFDTLLSMLTPKEIQSVLAHEIGHYKKKHITKSIMMSFALSLLGFYIIYEITLYHSLFFQLGINPNSTSEIVMFFSLLLPCILFFLNPIFSSFSRKNEFEADNYAKEFSNKRDLISSLKKLYKENLTLLKTSPIYSRVYNSHPTVFERINNLEL
tara:strand:+ start:827 stop:2056 length:1230 start_codon:yes stop_codon:yes gene_type:complete